MSAVECGPDALCGNFPDSPVSLRGRKGEFAIESVSDRCSLSRHSGLTTHVLIPILFGSDHSRSHTDLVMSGWGVGWLTASNKSARSGRVSALHAQERLRTGMW